MWSFKSFIRRHQQAQPAANRNAGAVYNRPGVSDFSQHDAAPHGRRHELIRASAQLGYIDPLALGPGPETEFRELVDVPKLG
jgi:hypothetical protein